MKLMSAIVADTHICISCFAASLLCVSKLASLLVALAYERNSSFDEPDRFTLISFLPHLKDLLLFPYHQLCHVSQDYKRLAPGR